MRNPIRRWCANNEWAEATKTRISPYFLHALITVVGPLAALAFIPVDKNIKDWDWNDLTPVALYLTVLIFILGGQWWDEHKTSKNEEKRSKTIINFNDNLYTLLNAFRHYETSNREKRDIDQLINSILETGVKLFPVAQTRLCLYKLEEIPNEQEDPEQQSTKVLQLLAYAGRADTPRPQFNSASEHGKHVLDLSVRRNATPFRYYECKRSSEIDRQPHSIWKSFAQFPIHTTTQPLGVLMVDCREDVDWNREHQSIVQTIVSALQITLEILEEQDETFQNAGVTWEDMNKVRTLK